MPNEGFGQGPKKETVYGGPAVASPQGTVYGGPPMPSSGGTVYGGPPAQTGGGTVYGGPSAGTVPRPIGDKSAVHPQTNKAANAFFIIAGLSAVNTVLAIAGAGFAMALGLGITRGFDSTLGRGGSVGIVAFFNLVIVGVFVLIGMIARKGSGVAILIGLVLYAGDTILLFMDGVGLHLVSLIVHGIFLFTIFSGYQATRS
jgi:hypothetical protein